MIKRTNSSSLIMMGTYKKLFITIYLMMQTLSLYLLIFIAIWFHSQIQKFSLWVFSLHTTCLVNILDFTSLPSRPNISFALNNVAKLSEKPSRNHCMALKHIALVDWYSSLCYVPTLELVKFIEFSNADYANDLDDCNFQSNQTKPFHDFEVHCKAPNWCSSLCTFLCTKCMSLIS